jgi:hypothetical protein
MYTCMYVYIYIYILTRKGLRVPRVWLRCGTVSWASGTCTCTSEIVNHIYVYTALISTFVFMSWRSLMCHTRNHVCDCQSHIRIYRLDMHMCVYELKISCADVQCNSRNHVCDCESHIRVYRLDMHMCVYELKISCADVQCNSRNHGCVYAIIYTHAHSRLGQLCAHNQSRYNRYTIQSLWGPFPSRHYHAWWVDITSWAGVRIDTISSCHASHVTDSMRLCTYVRTCALTWRLVIWPLRYRQRRHIPQERAHLGGREEQHLRTAYICIGMHTYVYTSTPIHMRACMCTRVSRSRPWPAHTCI